MKRGNLVIRLLVGGLSLVTVVSVQQDVYSQPPLPKFAEVNFRKMAKTVVKPTFPEKDQRAHKVGVAVALVSVDENGSVAKVEILEAPTVSIAQAVYSALFLWRFAPSTLAGRPTGFMGRVTYYFVMTNGNGTVLSPDEAPYLGRMPAGGASVPTK